MSLSTAIWHAEKSHRGQVYGRLPYIVHPQAVYATLVRFGVSDENVLQAAWLHDAIEDSDDRERAAARIEMLLGRKVLDLVKAVTDAPGVFQNRRERHQRTYPRTLAAGTKAVQLKLADRIANVESSIQTGDSKLEMYRREQPMFRELLTSKSARPDSTELVMWRHLEDLLRKP